MTEENRKKEEIGLKGKFTASAAAPTALQEYPELQPATSA